MNSTTEFNGKYFIEEADDEMKEKKEKKEYAELTELRTRVQVVEDYIKSVKYPEIKIICVILGINCPEEDE